MAKKKRKQRAKKVVTLADLEVFWKRIRKYNHRYLNRLKKKVRHLCVLSFGAGQDSTAILLMMIYFPEIMRKYAPDKLLVVFADTGNEYPYTYEHLANIKLLCKLHKIEFVHITGDMGHHTPSYAGGIEKVQSRKGGEKYQPTYFVTKKHTCSIQFKIEPIYKFLDCWLNQWMSYGFDDSKGNCNKQALKKFGYENGKIRVLIGFSKGEESRALKGLNFEEGKLKLWEKQAAKADGKDQFTTGTGCWDYHIERQFPLIDHDMDRDACIALIESKLDYVVMPSQCMMCPFQKPAELLWLARNYPMMWDTWVNIEENKKNYFTSEGKLESAGPIYIDHTLPQMLDKAIEEFGHMTNDELWEYKKRHGCATGFGA